MRCNCENGRCPHGEKACPNEAGDKKVMYVGRVCDACYGRMSPEYRLPQKKRFEVVVGNIGSVYTGSNPVEAADTFEDYMKQSKSGRGRAAGEDVVLFEDGEITIEHIGVGVRQRR
jgi:hypothetical protein